MEGFEAPIFLDSDISGVSASFQLELPDPANWSAVIPADVGQLIEGFPDPQELVASLQTPIAQIKQVTSFDFGGERSRFEAHIEGLQFGEIESPRALFQEVFGAFNSLGEYLKESELVQLVMAVLEFMGIDGTESWHADLDVQMREWSDLFEKRIGGVFCGISTLASITTSVANTRQHVGRLTNIFSLDQTTARFQAVINGYGGGVDSLGTRLAALDWGDAVQVAAIKKDIESTVEAFAGYHTKLVRDLAFMEATTAVFDIEAIGRHFEQAGQVLEEIETDQVAQLAARIEGVLDTVKSSIAYDPGFNLEQFTGLIQSGLTTVHEEIDKLDPARIQEALQSFFSVVQEPLQQIESFKVEVEALIRSSFDTIKDAIGRIDISTVQGSFEQALGEVEQLVQGVDQEIAAVRSTIESTLNTAQSSLQEVEQFIRDPDGLKAQIEEVYQLALSLLDELNIDQIVETISETTGTIASKLEKIEFDPVFNTTCDAIGTVTDVLKTVAPLLVTDALEQELENATQFLRQIDIGAIQEELIKTFDEILENIDEEGLGEVQRAYEQVIEAIRSVDPSPFLIEVQENVFNPVIETLEEFKPVEFFKPLQEAFDSAQETLEGFNPTEAFSFLTGFFEEINAVIESISPEQLLQPIEEALEEVRTAIIEFLRFDEITGFLENISDLILPAIDRIDLTPLFDAIDSGYDGFRERVLALDTSKVIEPLSDLLKNLLAPLGFDVNRIGIEDLFEVVRTGSVQVGTQYNGLIEQLNQTREQLTALDIQASLMDLRTRQNELKVALRTHDPSEPGYAEIDIMVVALDPMPVLSPLIDKLNRTRTAFSAKADAFSEALQQGSGLFDRVDALLSDFESIFGLFSRLKEIGDSLFRPLFPDVPENNFNELIARFFDAVNPLQWRTEIERIIQTVKTKLSAVFGGAVLTPLKDTLDDFRGLIDILDISELTTAVRGLYQEVEQAVQQFDPTPFLESITETYNRILQTLEQLNPDDFIQQIDQIYTEDVIGVVKEISPAELLLKPLKKLFDELANRLGVLDIRSLFAPVLDHLKSLRDQLSEGLLKVDEAYDEMLDAIPTGGGSSASVSASVSIGS